MKYLFSILLAFSFLIAFPITVDAQIGKKLRDKLEGLTEKPPTEKELHGVDSDRTYIPKRPILETEGITSPTHKKHQNSIVFSHKPIERGEEDETAFINSATLGQPLYYRVYMDNSFYNYAQDKKGTESASVNMIKYYSTYKLSILLNDKLITESIISDKTLNEEDRTIRTTFDGALASENSRKTYLAGIKSAMYVGKDDNGRAYSEVFSGSVGVLRFKDFLIGAEQKLKPGKHKVTLKVEPIYFYYYPGGDTKPVYTSTSFVADLDLTVEENIVDVSNREVCPTRGKMDKDKVLLESIKSAYEEETGDLLNDEDIFVVNNRWKIRRTKEGMITDRLIQVNVIYRESGKCISRKCGFIEAYNGSDYEALSLFYVSDKPKPAVCNCARR